MKKLYFLAMGCNYDPINDKDMIGSDVLNYRIRTTFHDKDSNIIFIEVSNGKEFNKKGVVTNKIKLYVNHLYNKTLSEDENKSHIKPDDDKVKNYTKKDILYFINESFGTDFDELVVISHLSQFDYNLITGDEFKPNFEKLHQVMKIDKYFYDYQKNILGKKYPNHSIYFDKDILKIVIHYNGFNDIINIDNVFDYKFDYKKPEGAMIV